VNPIKITVLFSFDSLVIYSDTLYSFDSTDNYVFSELSRLNQTGYKSCRVYFDAITNANSDSSYLNLTIRSREPGNPNNFLYHMDLVFLGNKIDTSYNNEFFVNRTDTYNLDYIMTIGFRYMFGTHKYIKVYNFKITQN